MTRQMRMTFRRCILLFVVVVDAVVVVVTHKCYRVQSKLRISHMRDAMERERKRERKRIGDFLHININ